jgi:hypothetical protein
MRMFHFHTSFPWPLARAAARARESIYSPYHVYASRACARGTRVCHVSMRCCAPAVAHDAHAHVQASLHVHAVESPSSIWPAARAGRRLAPAAQHVPQARSARATACCACACCRRRCRQLQAAVLELDRELRRGTRTYRERSDSITHLDSAKEEALHTFYHVISRYEARRKRETQTEFSPPCASSSGGRGYELHRYCGRFGAVIHSGDKLWCVVDEGFGLEPERRQQKHE